MELLIRIAKVIGVIALITVATAAIVVAKKEYDTRQSKTKQQIEQIRLESETKQRQQKDQYELKIKNLETQLQAKLAEKARLAAIEAAKTAEKAKLAQVLAQPAQASEVPQNASDAKMFIYMRESGNRTNAINPSSGACGLGQALPCSKMPCSLSDYACQDQFFTNYMLNRYGSWENAKAFWLNHRWW